MARGRAWRLQESLGERLRETLGAAYPPIGRRHEYVGPRVLEAVQKIETAANMQLAVVPAAHVDALSAADIAALYRVLRTVYLSELVFGDSARAQRWLCTPKVRLHGRVPLLLAAHSEHAHDLEQWLMDIDEGCHR